MKFLVAIIALGVWQCAALEPTLLEDENVGAVSPVGDCPPIDGEFPVLLPDSSNKSIFYICSNGRPIALCCPNGLEFSPEVKGCIAPQTYSPVGDCPPVDGDRPTFLPDSENSTIYYECVRGVPILMFCPPGLVFNPNLSVCDWPAKTEQPRGECPDIENGVVTLLADQVSCSTYYVCFAGKPFMATCPEGLLFNSEMNYCDFPVNVKCPQDKDQDEKGEDEEDQ